MRFKTTLALAMMLAPATALPAAGLDNFYGVSMAACVPTGQTSAASVLFNSAAEASFRDGGFGEIILTCPIPNTVVGVKSFIVRFKDDGTLGGGSQVVTALRRKSYTFNYLSSSASTDSTTSTIAEADSNAFVSPVVSPQGYRDFQKFLLPSRGTYTFDHRKFFYYIQVNMRRPAGTTGPVTVAYVNLGY